MMHNLYLLSDAWRVLPEVRVRRHESLSSFGSIHGTPVDLLLELPD